MDQNSLEIFLKIKKRILKKKNRKIEKGFFLHIVLLFQNKFVKNF